MAEADETATSIVNLSLDLFHLLGLGLFQKLFENLAVERQLFLFLLHLSGALRLERLVQKLLRRLLLSSLLFGGFLLFQLAQLSFLALSAYMTQWRYWGWG